MTNLNRQTQSWELARRGNNEWSLMPRLGTTRVTLERVWEKPDEVAWATVSIRRGSASVVDLPPADLDELIELLQDIRDDLTEMEVAGPQAIRKHNAQLRTEKLRAAREAREAEEAERDQCT